jgi:hypothetical protein
MAPCLSPVGCEWMSVSPVRVNPLLHFLPAFVSFSFTSTQTINTSCRVDPIHKWALICEPTQSTPQRPPRRLLPRLMFLLLPCQYAWTTSLDIAGCPDRASHLHLQATGSMSCTSFSPRRGCLPFISSKVSLKQCWMYGLMNLAPP